MPTEVACGNCQGRLLIETAGIVVACPHCGTHISIPNPETSNESNTASDAIPQTESAGQSATEQNDDRVAVTQEAAVPATAGDEVVVAQQSTTASDAAEPEPTTVTETRDKVAPPVDDVAQQSASTDSTVPEESPAWMPPAKLPNDAHANESAGMAFPDFSEIDLPSSTEAAPTTESVESNDNNDADPELHISPDITVTDATEAETAAPAAEPMSASDSDNSDETETEEPHTAFQPHDETASESAAVLNPDETVGADDVPPAEPVSETSDTLTESADQPAETTVATMMPTAANRRNLVPKSLFIIVVSYASAVTFFCLYLLFNGGEAAIRRELEHLPDLKPPTKNKKIALRLIGEGESMNAGHTLKLGESQRYGNVKVTPLRVTRGPITFEYYSGDTSQTREPSQPVLKLWLRFENVSRDQVFAPLDRLLVMKSVEDKKQKEFGRFRANNFVCRLNDKGKLDSQVLMFNNTPYVLSSSDWNLKGQTIGQDVKPGGKLETYIPTEEDGLDRLKGELVWRIQFRKGYNPESLRGVTTLIEVRFHSDDIQSG